MVYMMKKMTIEEFGKQLIKTGDLDPVYNAIVGAKLKQEQLSKLLIAYWYFYHLGSAAWLSEQEDFWDMMIVAAENVKPTPWGGRWPRSAERRHFRGKKAIEAITSFSTSAKEEIDWILDYGDTPTILAEEVMDKVRSFPMCGAWISFKAADMLERCMGASIVFPEDLCYIYKEPRAALDLLNPQNPEAEMKRLLAFFRRFKAPPTQDRPCGVQEVETILCKWKSHMNGHYWVGKDIHEIRQGLKGWGTTAQKLLANCPKEVAKPGELF